MKRVLGSLLLLSLAPLSVRAHFIWLLPERVEGKVQVRLVFSDTPAPDSAELLKKVAHTDVFSLGADGKATAVKFAQQKDAFLLKLPGAGAQLLGATCRYGVVQRGKAEPYTLSYCAKTWVGPTPKNPGKLFAAATARLDLDIVPVVDGGASARVLWKGKPAAGAEVVLYVPGMDKTVKVKTDKDGTFKLVKPTKLGHYAIRAKFVVAQPGTYKGKQFKEARYYSTLVFNTVNRPKVGARPQRSVRLAARDARPKENPAATKLLADARAARANWHNFPGFSADLEVNVNGKVTRGRVEVNAKGKVTLSGIDEAAVARETRRQLSSIVGHRTDNGGDLKTPCAFADHDAHNPLGRTIRVLNDEFHSSYRIRDRQVIVVNRSMRDTRFTITVLENKLNEEKHFLPVCYVVNTWNLKTHALVRSQAFHQDWTRVGKFDLPLSALTVTASADGKQTARRLKLSNHKLKGK